MASSHRTGSGNNQTSGNIQAPPKTAPSHRQKSDSKTSSRPSTIATGREYVKPSSRLNPRTVDPFNKSASKSVFASAYTKDTIPCRLVHGSVRHKIQWSIPPEQLSYDPLLITFAEGLKETMHPYAFVAHEGFIQMLMVNDAESRVLPILPKLIPPFKSALMTNDEKSFLSTLTALGKLSDVTGPSLNVHLKNLLPQMARRTGDKRTKDHVTTSLQKLESNGGAECTSIIKSRIPTYSSVL